MRKLAATILVGATLASSCASAAQTHDYIQRYAAWYQQFGSSAPHNNIAANGRCDGISYGTGAMSCGTETGGPAGGLSSRN